MSLKKVLCVIALSCLLAGEGSGPVSACIRASVPYGAVKMTRRLVVDGIDKTRSCIRELFRRYL